MHSDPRTADGDVVEIDEARKGRRLPARILAELRNHPMAYGVLAVALIMGPIIAHMIFPEAPLSVTIVGGLAVGVYAGVCAVPGKFL